MAHAVRSSRNTSQSCTDNRNFGSTKLCTWLWRVGGEKVAKDPLDELVDERERMEEWVLHDQRLRSHNR
jgi:hypothetical protein